MTKIAYTGGGTVGHVSVNLSLIPTSIGKDTKHFILVQNMVLKGK